MTTFKVLRDTTEADGTRYQQIAVPESAVNSDDKDALHPWAHADSVLPEITAPIDSTGRPERNSDREPQPAGISSGWVVVSPGVCWWYWLVPFIHVTP